MRCLRTTTVEDGVHTLTKKSSAWDRSAVAPKAKKELDRMVSFSAKEEGPAYKDQVRSRPYEVEQQNPANVLLFRTGEQNGILGPPAPPVKAYIYAHE